jgi:hypothetical protein
VANLFISTSALLTLHYDSGRHLTHFTSAAGWTRCRELYIHFLKAHSEAFNLLLQARNGFSLFLHCLVLLEKLIERKADGISEAIRQRRLLAAN